MGLRERQREKRRKAILLAAERLFRKYGYEGTSQELIASSAEVSAGTLYNYFPSKADLLLALVDATDDLCVMEGRALIDLPPGNPVTALSKIAALASAHSIRHLDKKIWRHVIAASFTNAESEFGHRYAATTGRLRQLTIDMLKKLQEKRRLRSDFDPVEVGYYMHAMKHSLFCQYILSDEMTFEDHAKQIRRAVSAVVSGLKIEKVAAVKSRSASQSAQSGVVRE